MRGADDYSEWKRITYQLSHSEDSLTEKILQKKRELKSW